MASTEGSTGLERPEPVHQRVAQDHAEEDTHHRGSNDDDSAVYELYDLNLDGSIHDRERRLHLERTKRLSNIRRFWRKHVSLHVPQKGARDHLALERTYLGYLRTSLALTNFGVTYAQLFRLQMAGAGNQLFYDSGIPIAVVFVFAGLAVSLLGCWRFYRQQAALGRGMIRKAGWDISMVFSVVLVMILLVFSAIVGIEIQSDQ